MLKGTQRGNHVETMTDTFYFLPWGCDGFLPLFKDSVYPVGLCEQRSVAETHPQAQEDPSE